MTNLQKFLAGLDPLNPNSVFRISAFARAGSNYQISFHLWPEKLTSSISRRLDHGKLGYARGPNFFFQRIDAADCRSYRGRCEQTLLSPQPRAVRSTIPKLRANARADENKQTGAFPSPGSRFASSGVRPGLAIKVGLRDLPPISFVAIRFVIAIAVLVAVSVGRVRLLPLRRSDYVLLAFTGVLMFAVNYTLLFWGASRLLRSRRRLSGNDSHLRNGFRALDVAGRTVGACKNFLAHLSRSEESRSSVHVC